jgi:Cd2+/Zn2+-exporting ATPase
VSQITVGRAAGAVPGQDRYRVVAGCLDCAGDLEKVVAGLPGVEHVDVLSAAGAVVVTHDGQATASQITAQAARLGVELERTRAAHRAASASLTPWWRRPEWVLLAAASVLLVAGFAVDHVTDIEGAATGAYLAAVALGGIYPLRSALRVVAQRRLSIGTLLVAGTVGALALGVVEEAALLVVVFSLGEVLEDYVADRARNSIRSLMALAPPSARRIGPGETTDDVPVEDLAPGDRILVRPGERLPTDGQVTHGRSWIDQSPITGESIPVEIGPGSIVFGGTVNTTGVLRIAVAKPWADTVLARVIDQVERAQANRGTAQRFAERFGAVYTPVMFALAAVIAAVGPVAGLEVRDAIYRALVVLVVSCSCALVISVPVAVVAAVSRAARDGILIKGGAHLEALASVDTVAFDKTGTLTRGQPALTDLITLDGHDPDELLRHAAAVEAASHHPLADAVTAAANYRGLTILTASEAQAIPGRGVRASIEGHDVFVGRPATASGVDEQLAALERAGKTTALVTINGQAHGILALADQLRPDAATTVAALGQLGIDRLVLLTGDNPRTAQAIATNLGIDDYRAGLLPQDKTTAVTDLRAQHRRVAMVGDGINDAPALATADVGIAMGAAGSDIALETADVALMADDLTKLPDAIALARRARTVIRRNIALSLATVALLVTTALTGQLTLATGLILNEGAALVIIANGLRLLRHKPPAITQPPTRSASTGEEPPR